MRIKIANLLKSLVVAFLFSYIVIINFSCSKIRLSDYENEKDNIINYLKINRSNEFENASKGIESLGLISEQNDYYQKKIDYFIDVILDNIDGKKKFAEFRLEYYSKFPDHSAIYKYYSDNQINFVITELIKNKFGNIEIPINV